MKDFSLSFSEDRLRETAFFFLKMMVAGIVFRAVLFLDPSTYILQQWLASTTAFILNLGGLDLTLNGIILGSERASYIVTRDCLGWKSMAAFTALMLASTGRTRWRKIMKPLAIGLLVITGLNLLRVVTTVYLSHQGVISFEIIHTFFWRWGMTLGVLALWFYWLRQDLTVEGLKIENILKREGQN